jgi:hypothetical protein
MQDVFNASNSRLLCCIRQYLLDAYEYALSRYLTHRFLSDKLSGDEALSSKDCALCRLFTLIKPLPKQGVSCSSS